MGRCSVDFSMFLESETTSVKNFALIIWCCWSQYINFKIDISFKIIDISFKLKIVLNSKCLWWHIYMSENAKKCV